MENYTDNISAIPPAFLIKKIVHTLIPHKYVDYSAICYHSERGTYESSVSRPLPKFLMINKVKIISTIPTGSAINAVCTNPATKYVTKDTAATVIA